jgi:hypothetical protein
MKRALWLLLLLISPLCFGQGNGFNAFQQTTFATTTTATPIFERTTILFHQVSWVTTGTVTTCSVRVDSSPDNVTYAAGGIIGATTCTGSGSGTITAGSAAYIRVNVTTLTGGGTVTIFYKGWAFNPTPSTGTGNVTAGGTLTSGNVVTGAGSTAVQDSGIAASSLLLNNASGQIITQSTSGMSWQTIPCASLSANTTNNAGCAATFNSIIVNSIGTAQANLRKGLNIYYEGNGQQNAADFGLQINAMLLLDANSGASATITGVDSNTLVQGSTVTPATIYGFDSRPRLFTAGTHVLRMVYYHGAATNAIPAGTTVDLLQGIAIGSSVAGTVTSSSGIYLDLDNFQYGSNLSGSIRAGILNDTTAAKSGLCHGTYTGAVPMVVTEHDCWVNGSNTPEAAVTANIGSHFSRLNGADGTEVYYKASGTGNTGWLPRNTTAQYFTSTNCSANGTAASPSVTSCAAASAGAFSCATNASAGICRINTTAVTANSDIFVIFATGTTLNTRLGVTCNTAPTIVPSVPIAAIVAGTSFDINAPTFTVNPVCGYYWFVN